MSRTVIEPFRKPIELNQGGTSTAQKAFVDSAGSPVILPVPQGYLGPSLTSGRQLLRLKVIAGGRVTGGTSTAYYCNLAWGSSATVASNTPLLYGLATGLGTTINSVRVAWDITADLFIYVTATATARVTGYIVASCIGSTDGANDYTSPVQVVQGVTFSTTRDNLPIGFIATGAFTVGNAANEAYLDYCSAEIIQ